MINIGTCLNNRNRTSSKLMNHGVYFIAIFHFEFVGEMLCKDATPVKQKNNGVELHRLMITVCIHKLFQLCVSIDLERHFNSILTLHFEIDVCALENYLLIFLLFYFPRRHLSPTDLFIYNENL